jgi:hypothetical protein
MNRSCIEEVELLKKVKLKEVKDINVRKQKENELITDLERARSGKEEDLITSDTKRASQGSDFNAIPEQELVGAGNQHASRYESHYGDSDTNLDYRSF